MATKQPITEADIEKYLQLPLPRYDRFVDFTGKPHGDRWIICYAGKRGRYHFWLCRCKCGRLDLVATPEIIRGSSTMCASCKQKAVGSRNFKHGMCDSSEYSSYSSMVKRCLNSNYPQFHIYGGRGITVCERWQGKHGFENFYADMGPKPSPEYEIDRIDVNGNYEPGNCRWATQKEQARNTRTNRLITFRGETKPLTQLAEEAGINAGTVFGRLRAGWSVERALTEPPQRSKWNRITG